MEPEAGINTLNTIVHHRLHVQEALQTIIQALERRALVHDASKLTADEFEGFTRINSAARNFAYGSPEYRAALKQEKPTIQLHYARNSHHPEYWDRPDHNLGPGHMGLLDMIEMVCDWRGAWTVYEGQRAPDQRLTWPQNIDKQRERYAATFTPEQWYLIDMIAALVATRNP